MHSKHQKESTTQREMQEKDRGWGGAPAIKGDYSTLTIRYEVVADYTSACSFWNNNHPNNSNFTIF